MMTHYSEDPSLVRVDFFKPSGKFYATEAVKFGPYEGDIHSAFKSSLKTHLQGRMKGMTAVCVDPCHISAHPLMTVIPDDISN